MSGSGEPLRILHVLRSPVGGLFRHVLDVVRGQAARGHAVGLVCDTLTGGERAARALADLTPHLTLGVTRLAMPRHIGLTDYLATRHVADRIAREKPDVVHGHGAKGAAYARLAAGRNGPVRVCTPHGGSLLFKPNTPVGAFYMTLEKVLKQRTDLFLFESAFIEKLFRSKVGEPKPLERIVPNGVAENEFEDVPLQPDATDLLYIGELRHLKGVDVLLQALAALHASGQRLTATVVGDGNARLELHALAKDLGLGDAVRFHLPMPARQAFALGRIMVVPSRAESFPYIVLEAAAAGKPLIVTRVGGIADMFGPYAGRLIPPDDRDALVAAIRDCVNLPERTIDDARLLRERVRTTFSLDDMVDGGIAAYRAALAARKS